jgi:hypothetical protein
MEHLILAASLAVAALGVFYIKARKPAYRTVRVEKKSRY